MRCVCLLLVALSMTRAGLALGGDDPVLWYEHPASEVNETLPVGNGRFGAMIFGGGQDERIRLTAGDAPNAAELRIRMTDAGVPVRYRRQLDLDTAIATTRFALDGIRHEREIFASRMNDVLVVRLTVDRPGGIAFDVALSGRVEVDAREEQRRLHAEGPAAGDGPSGDPSYNVVAQVDATGGTCVARDGGLSVRDANAVTIWVTMASGDGASGLRAESVQRIEAAARRPYELVRRDHIGAHQRLFRRVDLRLDGGLTDQATDVRLERSRTGAADPGLDALLVQLARYLLIAGSRAGEDVGWSRAWLTSFMGRWDDDASGLERVRELLTHPRSVDTGIADMLARSAAGEIELLPSLPTAWPTGSARGLPADGGFSVNIQWRDGAMIETEIESTLGGTCAVRYRKRAILFPTEAGGTYVLVAGDYAE